MATIIKSAEEKKKHNSINSND